MEEYPAISVIVVNYNYAPFLADAIESALRQCYRSTEVIVVDDGSTDRSRRVLEDYDGHVISVLKENGGQASAFNAGFARSSGDVVIFLDSDDLLLPDTAERVAHAFRQHPDAVGVHYRLNVIDAAGNRTGDVVPPHYLPLPHGDFRRDVRTLINCASWSPTSGNAFAARALRKILPMPEPAFRTCADYYLVRATALLGPVYPLDRISACYRKHAANTYFTSDLDLEQVRRRIEVTRTAYAHIDAFAGSLGIPFDFERAGTVDDEMYLAQRLISRKLAPSRHPLPADSLPSLGRRGAGAALRRTDLTVSTRLMHLLWFAGMVALPRTYAAGLARQFFPQQRRTVNRLLQRLQRTKTEPVRNRAGNFAVERTRVHDGSQNGSIVVVIINHNTCQQLQSCLESVLAEAPHEVIVVDNASTDGSVEMVRELFPGVRLVENATNVGYGAAANQAIARSGADYVLLLNSDTHLSRGALADLGKYLGTHPEVAVVGPRLTNPDGTLQPSCFPFPSPLHLLVEESTLGRRLGSVPVLGGWYLRTWSHSSARQIPWVLGAALALRRTAFESVDGFDGTFHMYFEETDLCYRLADAGWQVHFTPATTIVHEGGASTRRRRAEMYAQLFVSMRLFYQRHYSTWRLVTLTGIVTLLMLLKVIRDTVALHVTREPRRRAILTKNLTLWRAVLAAYYDRRGASGRTDALSGSVS